MAPVPDPYLVLGVARGATKAQIKAAHRTLAKRYHPDAATGDAKRFRDLHEAYQLLSDPLRRREWDAHHAPGPVRADEPTKRAPRRRRTTAAGDDPSTVRPEGATRTYRWSASEVPWWEEGARSENRRQPGARRPKPSSGSATGSQPPPSADQARQAEQPPRATGDFEVYNRSSGAAWSSAARQYFRRFDAELPSHGQFRRKGTQPLTAARARVAAEEEARAAQANPLGGGSASASTRTAPPPPQAAPPPQAPAPPAAAPRRAYAYTAAGVARTTEQVNAARAATARAFRAATWPTLRERLIYALLAWIPVALVLGYGGATATGCDHASVSCPAWFGPAQSVGIAITLGLLVGLPRIAFVGAVGTLGLTAAAIVAVAGLAMYRLEPPFEREVIAVVGTFLLGAYLLTLVVVALNRAMLPWVARR